MGESWEERTGAGNVVSDVIDFWKNSASHGMAETVPFSFSGKVDKGGGEDGVTCGGEIESYGVVHSPGHHGFELGSVGFCAEDVGCAVLARGSCMEMGDFLFGEGTFRPVEKSIGARVRSVKVVGAAGDGFAVEPDGSFVANVVVVWVGELPDGWRCGDEDGVVVPEDALRERDIFSEDSGFVVDPCPGGVFEAKDAVFGIFVLGFDGADG
ncbi:MAG: hypothetical protein RIS92_3241 [Verrucomicrobiota bacterium]